MKKTLILIVALLMVNVAFAQNKISYQGEVNVGYGIGVGDYGVDKLSVHVLNGIRFCPYFFAGVGVGYDHYSKSGDSASAIPLYGNAKGYLPVSKRTELFVSLDCGYNILFANSTTYNGYLVVPAVGAQFKLEGKKALNVSLGYDINRFTQGNKMRSLGLKVGFVF
ncbi:MAG: hypothetical protein PHD21_01685 [Flavobacteriales bacterium]|nr:hypothetical protein [Flavobacteriales bacterium]